MSAARRRKRMELRIRDGKIKATAVEKASGFTGSIVFGDDVKFNVKTGFTGGKSITVSGWDAEIRYAVPSEVN